MARTSSDPDYPSLILVYLLVAAVGVWALLRG